MSRGSGTGYIPDKSNLMSSTLAMLEFFKDGEKSFSQFLLFLKSNYNIETESTTRMTLTTLCKWRLLHEVDFKIYKLTDIGVNLLNTQSKITLGRQIHISTLYFGEILQELEAEVKTGSALRQAANKKYGLLFRASSDLSCRTQFLVGLGFVERSSKKYRITSQGRDFLQLLRSEKLISENNNNVESNRYIRLKLTDDFAKKCEQQKIAPEFVLHKLMAYYVNVETDFLIH